MQVYTTCWPRGDSHRRLDWAVAFGGTRVTEVWPHGLPRGHECLPCAAWGRVSMVAGSRRLTPASAAIEGDQREEFIASLIFATSHFPDPAARNLRPLRERVVLDGSEEQRQSGADRLGARAFVHRRWPSDFSLRGQRKVTKREATLFGACRARATASALPQLRHPCRRRVLAKRSRHRADSPLCLSSTTHRLTRGVEIKIKGNNQGNGTEVQPDA